ncbi:MAG TPA: ribosome small subunit-dependent GTPase A [Candidatus Dormibacteraeota bacterium]|nr:ribosome small subunit-dependent GTPase A [Candidatus Dormibacteraeota bacterium]
MLSDRIPVRVIADFGADYLVEDGDSTRRAAARRCDPAVGDWVHIDGDFIVEVLPRRTVFSRRAAGAETREQVLAANIDVAFVVAAAIDVNERRLERYLTIAWQSGAAPVVVVTKSDLVTSVEEPALAAPVIVTSVVTGAGIDDVRAQLNPSKTGVLLGPSGVGKSTLINALVGADVMRTREIHRSGEGRHMTSHRQLIHLPGGGMLIDTPGLREAQLWQGEDALSGVFEDIEALALQCRFADCSHQSEPGCAVNNAIVSGELDADRFASYRKLLRELRAVAMKGDARLRQDERRKWKQISMANRARERYLRR